MCPAQNSEKSGLSKDWRIVLNLVGSALLLAFIVFMIGYPIFRAKQKERFHERAEKAFGVLPALKRVADEVQAKYRTAYPRSEIEVGASFGEMGAIMYGERKVDPKELGDVDRFQLLVFNITEEELPRLNPIIARALGRQDVARVKVSPVLDRPEEIKVIHGKEVSMGDGFVEMGDTYTVEAVR